MALDAAYDVLELRVSAPAEKLVLAVIAQRADDATGRCIAGLETIAILSEMSAKQVGECVANLEDMGFIDTGPGPSVGLITFQLTRLAYRPSTKAAND